MRRVCSHMLGLLLLLSMVGCGMIGGNQQAANSPPPFATKADGNIIESVQSTPGLTTTVVPRVTPTARPTARPTSSAQSSGAAFTSTSLEKQLQQQLFARINQDRANQGLYAYTLNSVMSGGALLHSRKMSTCGMSHQCSGEASPCQRLSNEGISWTSCGENVGYTSANPTDWTGVEKIEQAMLAEQPPNDGHRLNLLNTSFTRVGVGIYVDASGLVWITEDFAN